MTTPRHPDPGSSIQALERERERVIAVLSRSFAGDHLSLDELETRLELAYRATSMAEVRALVTDLPEAAGPGSPAALRAAATPGESVRQRMVSIMSSRTRGGMWVAPRELRVISIMSETHIDLRDAQLSAGITEIRIRATMSAVRITVPPGVHVVTEASPFMGSVVDRTTRGPVPPAGAPVLRITGWAVMAEVVVRRRHPDDD
jgi:hypothetical protein